MGRLRQKAAYLPAVLWGLVIVSVTSIPYLTPPPLGFTFEDKAEHFAAYLIFGTSIVFGNWFGYKKTFILRTIIFCAIFGLLDEIHQRWIPGRSMDIYDWVADILGSTIGVVIMEWLTRHYNKFRLSRPQPDKIK